VEDDLFFLSCDVRGEPRPSVSWTLNGKAISQGNIFIQRERLRVNSSNAEVQGVYRCVANNTWGTVMSRRIRVNVLGIQLFHSSVSLTLLTRTPMLLTFYNKLMLFMSSSYPHSQLVVEYTTYIGVTGSP
jgi:hypothetical protein